MDAKGEKSLALFPAKFSKSMWIKRGSFVVVDASGKEKVLESGSKVACIVASSVLRTSSSTEEITRLARTLQIRSLRWMRWKFAGDTSQQEDNELDSSDGAGLPPLEANTNGNETADWKSDSDSDSGST